MKKERQSNFELLRIVAMLMVISLHFMGHGGILENVKLFSLNFYVANLIESLSIYAVNIYVLISAYFMCDSSITIEKILKVWTQVVFYTISIYLILVVGGMVEFNIINLIKSLFPVMFNQYSFVTAYIILMFLSPFLNKLIKTLNKDEFDKLMIVLFTFFIFLGLVLPIKTIVSNYITLLVVLYFIAAYTKKYLKNKITVKQSLLLYIGSSLLIFLGTIILYIVGLDQFKGDLISYQFILVIIGSIGLFTLFINMNIKSKIINNISVLTFGVFLIHDNNFLRRFIYSNIFRMGDLYNNKYLMIFTVLFIIILFSACSLIEYLRVKLFNVLKIDMVIFRIVDYLHNRISNYKIKNISRKGN